MNKLDPRIVEQFLEENNLIELQKYLLDFHPADIAILIEQLELEQGLKIFRLLNNEIASDVLVDLYDEIKEYIISNIKNDRLIKIINEMESDDVVDVLEELGKEKQEKILEHYNYKDSENLRALLKYDEDTAGGLMQSEIIAVKKEMRRDQLISYIRNNFKEVDNLYHVFVIDDNQILIGVLDILELLLADKEDKAKNLMNEDVIYVNVFTDQETVANIFRKYDIFSLPVVNDEKRLLGRITVDDIIDVIDEEAQEDAYKFAGLGNEDRVFTSPWNSVKKRVPWLFLNLFTALLVSFVVGLFEQTIAKITILAVLMPIVAGLGGNSGTQTLTVITRGIAMGELTIYNSWRAVLKEIGVAVTNGIIIGVSATVLAYFLKGDLLIGIVLGSAMIINIFIAGLFGTLIPVILKAVKIDPALASSVIITMLTDMCGFASFLGLATIIL